MVQKCALDIIAEVTMETNLHLQKDKNLKLMTSFNRIMNLTVVRSVSPWVWIQSIYDRTRNGKLFKDDIHQMELITKCVLQEQKYKREGSESVLVSNSEKDKIKSVRNKTLLKNVLLKQHCLNSSYTLDDVRRDIQTIVAAANDTTTTSICWTLSLLGRHPEAQQKVHEELDEIFRGTKDYEITTYHLRRMKYLECCVKESLRLYPSFPSVARVLDQELVLGQRFAMLEMKLLLAKVLCKCEIMATTPFEDLKIKYEVIIKASGGHPISIRRRTEFISCDQ
ncbi:cytochrome P450 4C1-like [Ixodes scapularis]|uniref:cytochrome P450 4C1-like n=1 Tax=Ixodes scapularis TaxID=6945 RepID=UPI001C3860B8|nr:cytochrome P450 4C1-like [Ixodes scapularis]